MIKPGKITDHSFVIAVIAFADLHGGDLCQAHFQVPPESVLMQRLTASLHMALSHRQDEVQQQAKYVRNISTYDELLLVLWAQTYFKFG